MSSLIETLQNAQASVKAPAHELKLGDYALPIGTDHMYDNNVVVSLRKKGYIGQITWMDPTNLDSPDRIYHLNFTESDIHGRQTFAFRRKNLQLLTADEAKKGLAIMEEGAAKAKTDAEAKLKALIEIKRQPVDSRTGFDIGEKSFLDSNMNFIKLYTALNEDKTGRGTGANYANARCCSLTKTTSNILVHIPKDWLTYYGYSSMDIKMWLKFLSQCDTGFKGYYLGESTMSNEFGTAIGTTPLPKFPNNNYYMRSDMPCYKVMLENKGTNMHNYMHFIMLRYMYNFQYWNIPTIALQIKRALGDQITAWEALLVAHMNHDYYNYYCLVSNNGGNGTAVPNRANAPKTIIQNAQSGNMNASFTYTRDKDLIAIRAAIRSKKYDAILEALPRWRKD